LALFNDLTMLPIAYDNQQAGSLPENPDVIKMLTVSFALGCLETAFSMVFAYGADPSGLFKGDFDIWTCKTPTQAAIWLQMFIAAELLIFTARAPKYIWNSLRPSAALFSSVMIGCVVCSLMAGLSQTFGGLQFTDIVLIWVYDIIGLIFADILKVQLFQFFKENTNVLPEQVVTGSISDKPAKHGHAGHDIEKGTEVDAHGQPAEDVTRASMSANRMTDWALQNAERMSSMDVGARPSQAHKNKRLSSANMVSMDANKAARESMSGRISLSHTVVHAGNGELRPSFISGSIRPNVPQNRSKF